MALSPDEIALRLEAQDVIVRYAACLDERDFDTYRSCFTKDVEFHGFPGGVIEGVDAWIEFVRGVLDNFETTQHMLGPPQFRVEGEVVHLRTELAAQHFHAEPAGRIFTLWGTYRSELVREDGAWRIRRHRLDTRATRTHDAYTG